jgi:hypothetical protein
VNTRSSPGRPLALVTAVAVGIALLAVSSPAFAQASRRATTSSTDEGAWFSLEVTGGRAALDSLGVPERRERAAVMIELVRRLHFSADIPVELQTAALDLSTAVTDLANLQNAIALGSSPDKPLVLDMARDRRSRRRLEEALSAAGLDLKESKQQYRVEDDTKDSALALRKRLAHVGIDVEQLKQRVMRGEGLTIQVPTISLPLPLSPETWSKVVFERDVPKRRLFVEILNDPAARLLYHGLVGLDAETRRWIGGQPQLLKRLYGDQEAIRSFALFGPALKISGGRVVVPGGKKAVQRWSAALDVDVAKPDRFVRRLFDHDGGRTAGLYFTVAGVDAPRQTFLLSTAETITDGNDRFRRLVSSFANCYPSSATTYPFTLRSYDSALLLLEVAITAAGEPAGPRWRRFWNRALSGDSLPDNPANDLRDLKNDGTVDAAWMVDTLCGADAADRGAVFVTFLAGHRTFSGVADAELPDALVALRARRLYPAVFMVLEQAGVRRSSTYAALARHAARLARLDDPARAITALQQFQGAVALTVGAIASETLPLAKGEALLESLAAVPFENERYDGRLADWIAREWLPAVGASTAPAGTPPASAELTVAGALAGRTQATPHPVQWEGLSYVVDFEDFARRRMIEVRKRQRGLTLDSVLELSRIATALQQKEITVEGVKALRAALAALAPQLRLETPATELADEGPDVQGKLTDVIKDLAKVDTARETRRAAEAGADLARSIDFLLGHVLASWAYAPHVGDADSAALVGGDGSLRHNFGLRGFGLQKFALRWEIALPTAAGGSVSGSILGLEAALASFSLRRLSSDVVPPAPTIGGNDLTSFMLTAALSNPRRLNESELARIAAAVQAGAAAIEQARLVPAQLDAAAQKAAMSPWRRESFSWMAVEEPDRLAEQFSITEVARIGGLRAEDVPAWGTASMTSGCLCLRMPLPRIPELIIGRAADGLLGGQSADLTIRIATMLAELRMPASLTTPVLAYAMRDFLDNVKPQYAADFDAFARQARALDRGAVEDILGAIAAIGPLRSAGPQR